MRIAFVVVALLFVQTMLAQCYTLFTLTTIGTDAVAVFEGNGAVNPQYIIDWGDGNIDTSLVAVMEHSYPSDGYYVAAYYYCDLDNPTCSFYSFEAFIITGGSCNLSFTAGSIANAVFVESTVQNVSVPFVTINWGDGSPDTMAFEGIHAYAQPGIYEVCLSLLDADPFLACTDSVCQNVEVIGLAAGCDLQVDANVDGQTTALHIEGNGAVDASYVVDWGDGSFSTSPDTSHTYSVPNYYTICVYYGATGDLSCQVSTCQEILIDPFASDCVFQFIPAVNGMDVELQVQAAGADQPEIFVDWGDGSAGQFGLPATYAYGAEGTYTICASYTDLLNPIGCQLGDCQEVVIGQSPTSCDVTLSVNQNGSQLTAMASGSGAIVPGYAIDWGDGSLPTLAFDGIHEFVNPGAYEVCVTYSDAQNAQCMATACETVNIVAGVDESAMIAALHISPNPIGENTAIVFSVQKPSSVQIELLDASGRWVETIYSGNAGQGLNRITWHSASLASGLYMIQLTADGKRAGVSVTK
jgi:hypothetical protein